MNNDNPFEEFIEKNLEADWKDVQTRLALPETKKPFFVAGYRRGAWRAFTMIAERISQGKITVLRNYL